MWPERDFPRTSTGKPRLNVIRESLRALREATTVAASSPLADLIYKISGRGVAVLKQESNLEDDLHLSSLDRVELMSALEDRYQVDLSETNFGAARTVGDLQQILNGKGGERVDYHYPHWTLSWPVRWVRALVYYTLMRPAIVLLGWPRIVGRENLQDVSGPVLVVCNHIDDADVGFVQMAFPARLRHGWQRPPEARRSKRSERLNLTEFSLPVLGPAEVGVGSRLAESFPSASRDGVSQKLRVCRRVCRSRIQHPRISGRTSHHRWPDVTVPCRNRAVGNAARCASCSYANRRIL